VALSNLKGVHIIQLQDIYSANRQSIDLLPISGPAGWRIFQV
jgi:hypothetical protein